MTTTVNPSRSVLSVKDLNTQFKTPTGVIRAVSNFTITLRSGRITGLVGESGSGKSVTAKSIMRMLPANGRLVSGSVELEGTDLTTLPERRMETIRGNEIGLIFQDPQNALNPVYSVGDQIAEAMTVHGTPKAEARQRALELMREVGIASPEEKYSAYPHEFSGGMKQRVVIATVLANEPKVLLADEPTTALDVTIQAQILELVKELVARRDTAVLLVTHDMGVVAETCDDVVVMYGGRTMETGPTRDIFTNPRHPYTQGLLRSMPRIDTDKSLDRLPAIPQGPNIAPHSIEACPFSPRCEFAEERCSVEMPPLETKGQGQVACWVKPAPHVGDVIERPRQHPGASPAPEPADEVLRVEGVQVDVVNPRGRRARKTPIYAVDGLSLSVPQGQTVGIVGESGCGKSSLARALMGINRITAGQVRLAGEPADYSTEQGVGAIRSRMQYVFQDPYGSLNRRRTVRQTLLESLEVDGVRGSEAEDRAVALLEQVGLSGDHLERYPSAFSGGQRQRIAIARSLASSPAVLLLDEPVSALDVSVQAQVINLLNDLQEANGTGYLFVAHNLSVVRFISDYVGVMYLGKLVEYDVAENIYSNPRHPYTMSLLSASPAPTVVETKRERIILAGDIPSPAAPPSGCRFRTRCPIGPLFRSGRELCSTQDPSPAGGIGLGGVACHFVDEAVELRQTI